MTALVVAGLLVVAFLDRPYEGQPGSVEPTEMRRTLAIIDREAPLRRPAPCDEDGTPRPV